MIEAEAPSGNDGPCTMDDIDDNDEPRVCLHCFGRSMRQVSSADDDVLVKSKEGNSEKAPNVCFRLPFCGDRDIQQATTRKGLVRQRRRSCELECVECGFVIDTESYDMFRLCVTTNGAAANGGGGASTTSKCSLDSSETSHTDLLGDDSSTGHSNDRVGGDGYKHDAVTEATATTAATLTSKDSDDDSYVSFDELLQLPCPENVANGEPTNTRKHKHCSNCQGNVFASWRFCPRCGYYVE